MLFSWYRSQHTSVHSLHIVKLNSKLQFKFFLLAIFVYIAYNVK